MFVTMLLLAPVLAQPSSDVTVTVFPPEAEVRAFLPSSPGAGDGVANGGTFQVQVAEFTLRLSAPGYETRDVTVTLRKADETAPGHWKYDFELRPEGAASIVRHEYRRHPLRSYGLTGLLLGGVFGAGLWTRKKARVDTVVAQSALKEIERQAQETQEHLDRVDPNLIGKSIDEYQVLSLLGEGAFARVFKVEHQQYRDIFALKLLRPELLDKNVGERVEREMSIGRDLVHPYLVRTFGFGTFREAPYLVLEYVEGTSLDERLAEGPMGLAEALSVLKKLSQGLEYAHAKGVVHRDLKPANIFLTPQAGVKILDFGIAKILDTEQRLTLTGQALGTPHYMSPEQARGLAGVASDIYALGAITFEMLTGAPPYDGDTALEVLTSHTFADIPSAREVRGEIPETLDQLLTEMLAKSPQDRPESMQLVLQRLEQVGA